MRSAYQTVLSRAPSDADLSDSIGFLDAQSKAYAGEGKSDAAELALMDLCQALIDSNEFVYID